MGVVTKATLWPLRAPLAHPIKTSFGQMNARPALLLCIEDEAGHCGWGEAWVNFPSWALAVNTVTLHALLPWVLHRPADPDTIATLLYQNVYRELIQSAHLGPIYQSLSAILLAVYDLQQKDRSRSGTDQCALGQDSFEVYGSGIGPDNIQPRVEEALAQGFRKVKIKVGFDPSLDHKNFMVAQNIAGRERVMVDANQAWNVDQAQKETQWYLDHGAIWIEEPVAALDFAGYHALAPFRAYLAAGENWLPEYLKISPLKPQVAILQPDLAKVGGFWGAQRLQDHMVGNYHAIAFHVLGTPINHAAALKAAGHWDQPVRLIEWDTNENPFNACIKGDWTIAQGVARVRPHAGLGIQVDTDKLSRYLVPELAPWHTVVDPQAK